MNDAVRGLKRPPPGTRPDPEPPCVEAVTVGCVVAGMALLGAPSLADSPTEAIDVRTLRFLLEQNMALKKKEEVEAGA